MRDETLETSSRRAPAKPLAEMATKGQRSWQRRQVDDEGERRLEVRQEPGVGCDQLAPSHSVGPRGTL